MKNNKKLYLFYFIFMTLLLIGFFVSAIFFKNLYIEFLCKIALAGTLCFISGFLVNSIGWSLGGKKYKKFRAIAAIAFPFSCLDLIFKTFNIKLLPQFLTIFLMLFAGLVFILTYFSSVLEMVKIKKLYPLPQVEKKIMKKERSYLPILLVVLAIVILTSLLLINPRNIFTPKAQFICGSVGVFLSLFAGIFFAIVSAAEIYKAGTEK
jgi:hypothetical protein